MIKNKNRTPTHRSWENMKQRCGNENNTSYHKYGGRGISYDPRWESFENFLSDMGHRPEGMTLDRRDPLGNYCKDNCRWADKYTQATNQRARVGTKSGHRNVYWAPTSNKWEVKIMRKGIEHHLGVFAEIQEAVLVRDAFLKNLVEV